MIRDPQVDAYLAELRTAPDATLAAMEAQAAAEHIPIVEPPTGQLLEVLARACGARRIVEVGTAIGVSTLYMARALPDGGTIVSFEVDPVRRDAAAAYLERAGVGARADLRLKPGLEGLAELEPGTFNMAFLDALKHEYGDYLSATMPLLRPGGVVVVDNVLMSGAVAAGKGDGHWSDESVATARAFNRALLDHPDLAAVTVTPVGDGVAVGVKRA